MVRRGELNTGPTLPGRLLDELGSGASSASSKKERKTSRKQLRQQARKEVKARRAQHARPRPSPTEAVVGKQKKSEDCAAKEGKKKRTRVDLDEPPVKRRALLALPTHNDPDDVLEKLSYKRLGMKAGDSLPGPSDGLDSFFNAINAGASSEEDDASEQEAGENGVDQGGRDSPVGGAEDAGDEIKHEEGHHKITGKRGLYVPPSLRSQSATAIATSADVQRRIRSLLNKLGESNISSVVDDLVTLATERGRRVILRQSFKELLSSAADGSRASERLSMAQAAVVAGCTGHLGAFAGAIFLEDLATQLDIYAAEHNSGACTSLLRILACLFSLGLAHSRLLFTFLSCLERRFDETAVVMIQALLASVGPKLRAADPAGLKQFIMALQDRAGAVGSAAISSRARLMLDLACTLKNNQKLGASFAADVPKSIVKWLQTTNVESAAAELGSLTWERLLDPSKIGLWWQHVIPGTALNPADGRLSLADEGPAELLALAAQQRMHSGVRQAVFCALMAAEDCVDAYERLLRLALPAAAQRDMVRVLVDCCLQEQLPNPYYALVAAQLAGHEYSHRISLQYCLWDHWKAIESYDVRRLTNLGRFVAQLLVAGALSLAVFKAAELGSDRLGARGILHFNVTFNALLSDVSEDAVIAAFTRIATGAQNGARAWNRILRSVFAECVNKLLVNGKMKCSAPPQLH